MKNHVNFLPQEIQQRCAGMRMLQRYYWFTILLFLGGIATALPYYSAQQSTLRELESNLATAQKSIAIEAQLNKVNQNISDLQLLVNRHQQLIGQHPPLASLAVLSEFVSKHKDSVQITTMSYDNSYIPSYSSNSNATVTSTPNPSNGPESTKGKIVIKARLLDPSLATTFIDTLRNSKRFKDVQLVSHSVDHQSDSYLSEIDLTCTF
jgi:hypothetical protein